MAEVISQGRQGKPRSPTPQHPKGFWSLQSSSRCGAGEPATTQEGTKQRMIDRIKREREGAEINPKMSKVEAFGSFFFFPWK